MIEDGDEILYSVFKRTKDEWNATYRLAFGTCLNNGLVEVLLVEGKYGTYKIVVKGVDDFGMVKVYSYMSSAMACFLNTIQRSSLEMEFLTNLGFKSFD